MAENTIQRIIEVDTSTSVRTVRELQAEVAKLRQELSQMSEGSAQYAALQRQAAEAERTLNETMEIGVQKLTAEAKSTAELNDMVNELLGAKGDLIEQMVQEQEVLKAVTAERKALDRAIKDNRISEEDAAQQKQRLLQLEIEYKTSLAQTRSSLNAVEKQTQAAKESYNDMSQTLGRMRTAYREMTKEERESAKGNELLTHIQALDRELKQLDASIGNNQRNVGNYGNAVDKLIPGFSKLFTAVQNLSGGTMTFSGVAKGAISALKGMTAQAMAFIATPIGAAIAAVVLAFQALKSIIGDLNEAIEGNITLTQEQARAQTAATAWQIEQQKANEGAARSWIKVKSAIAEAWEMLKVYYQAVYLGRWKEAWQVVTGVAETKAALRHIEDLKKQLHELRVGDPDEGRLGAIEKIAELESSIAKLREKATDHENYTEQEREEALRKVIEKNKELYAIKRQELSLQLAIAEAQHKASPDTAEFQEEWVRLRAQMKAIDEQEANSLRILTRSLNKYTDDAGRAADKTAADRIKAAQDTAAATEKILADTLKLQQEARADTLENEIKTAKENYKQDLANFNKTVKQKGIAEDVAAAYRKALAEKTEADIAEIRKKWTDKYFDEAKKEMDKEDAETRANYKSADDDLQRDADRQTAEAKRDISDPMELEQALSNIQQRLYEARISLIDKTLRSVSTGSDLFAELSNQRADLEIENIERVAEEERRAAEEKKKIDKAKWENSLNIASSTLNSLSTILGEESKAGKAAAAAAAIIDTYKAANSAYASMASIPIVGPALGAAAAAAAVVAGIANVKKILATNADGSNAATATADVATPAVPAVVTPPAVVEQVPLTRTLTGATDETNINPTGESQRVYVVYSDIEGAGQQVDVQQSESTF